MDMVERVAFAIAKARRDAEGQVRPSQLYEHLARAAIAAMSDELLAHFQGALDSPALAEIEKYRVSVCMDDIRQIANPEGKSHG